MQTRSRIFFQMWTRRSIFYRGAAVVLLAACPVGWGSSTSSVLLLRSGLQKDISNYLTARSSIEHISTISMTVSLGNGQPDINVVTGTTQYGGNVAVTPANVFHIGSNTKAFTAVAVLQLEAAGALSINDTLGKWLPQYPAWSKVTIRQLLNMTSGIPNYSASPAWEADFAANPMTEFTAARLVAYAYPTLDTPPGSAWAYCNTGFILAQMIVDKASRSRRYQTELRRIIHQAGLNNTYYEADFYPQSVTRRLVSGYFVNTDDPGLSKLLGKDIRGFSLGWTQGAGGIIATPEDLTRWIRALFQGNVLPPKQLQELESLVAIPSGNPISQTSPSQPQAFGLGIFQFTDPTFGLVWGYEGSTIGYRATYLYFPKSGMIICAITNSQISAAENLFIKNLLPAVFATLKTAGSIR
ncbi:MAG: serine hydrolase domain-containing protein [Acidobacteriaceae bacterium]